MISYQNRGLQYGDGLFETMAVMAGEIPLWPLHLSRLEKGLERLGIDLDIEDIDAQVDEAAGLLSSGVLKLIVTRGMCARGYNPADALSADILIDAHPFPQFVESRWSAGVTVRLCDLRISEQPVLAGLKHLNRLENVLARGEWQDAEIAEGLLLDQHDNVIEGTCTNVFIVKGKTLFTPVLDRCGVQGVMRDYLIDLAKQFELTVTESNVSQAMLAAADEIFICNSLIGIWPVSKVQGMAEYTVGQVTRSLQYAINKRLPWLSVVVEK